MQIKLAKEENIDDCIKLQRIENNKKNMAPAFRQEFEKMVANKRLYIYIDKDELVGCIAYKYKKKNRVLEIYHFVVKECKRGKGIGKKLLSYLYNELKKYKLPIVVRCRRGAENNKLYLKYGDIKKITKGKDIDILTIYLNKKRMEELYAELWKSSNIM